MHKHSKWVALFFSLVFSGFILIGFLSGGQGLGVFQPPERRAINLFRNFRDDFFQVARSIQDDETIQFIDGHGVINPHSSSARVVPKYLNLIQLTSTKFIQRNSDGTIDFGMYAGGTGSIPDSVIGIRYRPQAKAKNLAVKLSGIVVPTLVDSKLPESSSGNLIGCYLVELEPSWFVFRNKYR